MHRSFLQTLAKSAEENRRLQARATGVPIDTDIMQRLHPRANKQWDAVRNTFRAMTGQIKAQYLGEGPGNEGKLFAIVVRPSTRMPTLMPPSSDTPYHISIAFYDPAQRAIFERVARRYRTWRRVTLRGRIFGSTFQLDANSPVANDADVQLLHRSGRYGNRELHVSL